MARRFLKYAMLFGIMVLSGCQLPARLTPAPPSLPTVYAELVLTLTPGASQPVEGSPSQTTPQPEEEVESTQNTIWLHPGLSDDFLNQLDLTGFNIVEREEEAALLIQPVPVGEAEVGSSIWTYALVAPFYTITDTLSWDELSDLWKGHSAGGFSQINVSAETEAALSILLGIPNDTTVKVMNVELLESYANGFQPIVAIIPFENLRPEWKVLSVDGISPIDTSFDPVNYPLSLAINAVGVSNLSMNLPEGNYDLTHRTTLIMTGVTALTRATAYQMEVRGNTFPGTDIKDWLTLCRPDPHQQ